MVTRDLRHNAGNAVTFSPALYHCVVTEEQGQLSVIAVAQKKKKKNRQWFSNHRLRIFSRHPSDSQSLSCRLLFSQKDAEDE